MTPYNHAVVFLLAVALASLVLAWFLLSRARGSPAAKVLGHLLLAAFLWSLADALESILPGLAAKFAADTVEQFAISVIPILLFVFGYRITERKLRGFRPVWILPWVVPALVSLASLFDLRWGLVRGGVQIVVAEGVEWLAKGPGPLYWVGAVYGWGLTAFSTIKICGAFLRPENGKAGKRLLLAAAGLLPLVAMSFDLLSRRSVTSLDPTPASLILTAVAFVVSFSRFRLLMALPLVTESALLAIRDGILIVDRDGKIIYFNDAASVFFGLEDGDSGSFLKDLLSIQSGLAGLHYEEGGEEPRIVEIGSPEGIISVEVRRTLLRKGRMRLAQVYTMHDVTRALAAERVLREANEDLERRIGERTSELSLANRRLVDELERRRETEHQLFYFSLHDPLTGLANRSLLMSRLGQAIERMRRDPGPPFGLLYLDFDDFKSVNDSYGHEFGDAFLREMAARLSKAVRAVDTVARLGGDEFIVLLDRVLGEEEAVEVGDRIAADLAVPFRSGSHVIVPSSSVGVLVASTEHSTPEEALRDADLAMYRAKAEGKNRRTVFDITMRSLAFEKTFIVNELRKALLDAKIEVHYQPVVRLEDGEIVGCEALSRWRHPELGYVEPERFIPIAEESGLIAPLGIHVLLESCRTALAIRESTGREDIFVAVNVSARQFAQPDFVEVFCSSIARFGLSSQAIQIEITESTLIENSERIMPLLEELSKRGFRFKLDDFGTGYSSFSYLYRLPISTIKIDRSFVAAIDAPGADLSGGAAPGILKAILSLGHELGKEVIAEGIETEAEAKVLREWGCEYGQGWRYGQALAREEWLAFLESALGRTRGLVSLLEPSQGEIQDAIET